MGDNFSSIKWLMVVGGSWGPRSRTTAFSKGRIVRVIDGAPFGGEVHLVVMLDEVDGVHSEKNFGQLIDGGGYVLASLFLPVPLPLRLAHVVRILGIVFVLSRRVAWLHVHCPGVHFWVKYGINVGLRGADVHARHIWHPSMGCKVREHYRCLASSHCVILFLVLSVLWRRGVGTVIVACTSICTSTRTSCISSCFSNSSDSG
mmetsp:Transcript_5139/g.7598  ORF Transcript_5139/g.7598 Transcript_5139/m.7598 type:complete len:203 (-) Transcript_5139:385-993(-)